MLHSISKILTVLIATSTPLLAQSTSDICVPQVVDGTSGTFEWRTTLTFRNQEQTESQARLEIRDGNGDVMETRVRRRATQQGPVETVGAGPSALDPIGPRSTVAYRSEADRPLRVGYAIVQSQERIQARVLLQLHDTNGALWAETTYVPQPLFRNATLHVDQTERGLVGIALVNPSELVGATVRLELHAASGALLGETETTIDPRSHVARFVHEWLPSELLADDTGHLAISSTSPVCGVALTFRDMTMTEAHLFVDPD